MRTRTRTQVYWRDGRIFPVANTRPSGLGPWPRVTLFRDNELVAVIEGETGQIDIVEGPAATLERVDEAFLLHRGVPPASLDTAVWSRVPTAIRREIQAKIQSAETDISALWGQFSNEETLTGAFFSRLNGSFRTEGWGVNISFVEFSKQTKEPQTGTDVAVVVDVLSTGGQRSFKSIWLQAKSSRASPTRTSSPPRMDAQMAAAQSYCQASYGLVYAPTGVFVLGTSASEPESFHAVMESCMQCHLGDTSVATLKNSLNRKKLLQVLVTEGVPRPVRRLVLPRR